MKSAPARRFLGRAIVLAVTLAALETAGAERPGQRMRAFADWSSRRPELRYGVAFGRWYRDDASTWTLDDGCVEGLPALGVRGRVLPFVPTPAPDPVIVEGPIGGITLHKRDREGPLVVACALAARLPRLAAILAAHGVTGVEISSAYRRAPAASYHHLGLALDITRFETRAGTLEVLRDFERARGRATCEGPEPAADPGRRLQHIVCDLARRGGLSTVLTPSYGRGHDNHLHVDIRPGDPWRFVR